MKVSKLLGLCFAMLAIFMFAVSPVFAGGGAEDPWSEDEGGEGNPNNGGLEPELDPTDPATGFDTSTFFGTDLWYLELIWDEIVGDDPFNANSPAPDYTENEDLGTETNSTVR